MFQRLIRILLIAGSAATGQLWAQPDPPPGGPGGGDPPVGGSPLDEGMAIILVLAGLYGLWVARHLLFRKKGTDTSSHSDPQTGGRMHENGG